MSSTIPNWNLSLSVLVYVHTPSLPGALHHLFSTLGHRAVESRGKVNAMAYMSTINTASRILLSSSGDAADAVEVQGCLGVLVICGFAQVAPDLTWLSFYFLDVIGVWRVRVQRRVLLWW